MADANPPVSPVAAVAAQPTITLTGTNMTITIATLLPNIGTAAVPTSGLAMNAPAPTSVASVAAFGTHTVIVQTNITATPVAATADATYSRVDATIATLTPNIGVAAVPASDQPGAGDVNLVGGTDFAVVAATAAVPTATVGLGKDVAPDATNVAAAVPNTFTIATGWTVTPGSVLDCTTTIPLPTVTTSAHADPPVSSVAAVAAVPTASATGVVNLTPATVNAVAAVPQADVGEVGVAAVAAVAAVPTVAVSIGVAPSSIAAVAAVPTVAVSSTHGATSVVAIGTLPAATASGNTTQTPATVTTTAAFGTFTVSFSAQVLPGGAPDTALDATAGIPTPAVSNNEEIPAATVSLVVSVPTPDLTADAPMQPATTNATAGFGVFVVTADGNVNLTQSGTVNATTTIPLPTVVAYADSQFWRSFDSSPVRVSGFDGGLTVSSGMETIREQG